MKSLLTLLIFTASSYSFVASSLVYYIKPKFDKFDAIYQAQLGTITRGCETPQVPLKKLKKRRPSKNILVAEEKLPCALHAHQIF